MISYRKCLGAVGGGTGVNYKVYLANKRYHYIENCYHIFMDQVIEPDTKEVVYGTLSSTSFNSKSIKKKLSRISTAWIFKHKRYRKRIRAYFKQLDQTYHFSDDDVYIFQDVESAHEFMQLFPFSRTALVYHQQGSLYCEWKNFNSYKLEGYRNYLNQYSDEVYKTVKVLAFPSNGAKESLLESEPFFEHTVNRREIVVLYNGVSKAELDHIQQSHELEEIVKKLSDFKGVKFATVAALNEAKGVERIPQYLAELKKKYSLQWVLVGDGICAKPLSDELEKYGLENDVIWNKKPMQHDEILKIFSLTDFYILFHRFSIFDYSTIEAMSYGNIPVLTPVGGNKEVIFNESGVFVEDFKDVNTFVKLLTENSIQELKQKNKEIQENEFSEETFLKRYQQMIETLNHGE